MKLQKKQQLARNRRYRVRKKVSGTVDRPRVSVRFTNQHIYAQAIDDETGKTLVAVSSTSKDLRDQKLKPNTKGAIEAGKLFGEKMRAQGIESIVFDRGCRLYHGAVQAFAEAARAAGLSF